ncbi:MAG: DUF4350 domain-containing protein [Gammaproteobacteria bacterium]|jgi:hypothetical protein
MSRVSVSVWTVLALLVFAVIGWLLYINIEFYEETEKASWSTEALRNPYLAAQQFMHESGVEITDVYSLTRLEELESVGTLFFSNAGQVQTPRQLAQVMDWLETGGNVIYTANSVADDGDLLLSELGVSVDWRDPDEETDSEEKSLSEQMREYNRQLEEGKSREEIVAQDDGEEISLTRVDFGDDIGELEVAFDNDIVLDHAYILDDEDSDTAYRPFSWSSSDYGIHMMQFEIGNGLLTVISDPGIWTSYRIDHHDHAYLLWLLSSGEGNFATLRSVLRESIMNLIMRNARELLIAAGLLILLWIWHRGYRFGRILPRDSTRRRALGEHFSSVSHYLWHRRNGDYLVAPLRQQVLRRASLTLAGFAAAEPPLQFELLAAHCDLNPEAVARAFGVDNFNEASFVYTVRLLKRIEQSL